MTWSIEDLVGYGLWAPRSRCPRRRAAAPVQKGRRGSWLGGHSEAGVFTPQLKRRRLPKPLCGMRLSKPVFTFFCLRISPSSQIRYDPLYYGCLWKNNPPEKKTLWEICLQRTKSEAGEQLLLLDCRAKAHRKGALFFSQTSVWLGWHYLSNATCLIRPRLVYACSVVSRITIHCQHIRHFWRTPALDK